MKEFLFVFRTDYQAMPKSSPEEMQAQLKKRGGDEKLYMKLGEFRRQK